MLDQESTKPLPMVARARDPRAERSASPVQSSERRLRRAGAGQPGLRRWASISIVTAAAAAAASAAAGPLSLQPMTQAQVMEAGAAGTGCSWSLHGDSRMRFAAADDRAAIRIEGKTVVLSPAPHARELFPFTFADWQAEGLTVGFSQVGATRRLGTEATTARARLTIANGGVSRRMDGIMSCGS